MWTEVNLLKFWRNQIFASMNFTNDSFEMRLSLRKESLNDTGVRLTNVLHKSYSDSMRPNGNIWSKSASKSCFLRQFSRSFKFNKSQWASESYNWISVLVFPIFIWLSWSYRQIQLFIIHHCSIAASFGCGFNSIIFGLILQSSEKQITNVRWNRIWTCFGIVRLVRIRRLWIWWIKGM